MSKQFLTYDDKLFYCMYYICILKYFIVTEIASLN